MNKSDSRSQQNLHNTERAVLTEIFMAVSAYIKKLGQPQINNQTIYFRDLEKQQQFKLKISRRKIIKIRKEINKQTNKI